MEAGGAGAGAAGAGAGGGGGTPRRKKGGGRGAEGLAGLGGVTRVDSWSSLLHGRKIRTFEEWRESEQGRADRAAGQPESPAAHGHSRDDGLVEYATLELRVHPPEVSVDNAVDESATVIAVDSANRPGTLVEVVQHLADLGMDTRRCLISSDGGWFVDVFYVTDDRGKKIEDVATQESIRNMLSIKKIEPESTKSRGASTTAIEVWGCDKPGLLSEITRLLVDNKLDLSNALVWTHKNRFAMILSLGEPMKVKEAKELQHYLMTSLEGAEELAGTGELWIQVKPDVPERHLERRLHSLMIQNEPMEELEAHSGVDVDIYFENDSGYTVVRVESPDRPRLMFDTVCTLSETFVDVIHGCVEVKEGLYSQEYFVKHSNGDCITSEKHMLLLKQHLVASAVRRNPTGLKVEVTCQDRVGLLADITKELSKAGLNVTLASAVRGDTPGTSSRETFYVTSASGGPACKKTVEQCCQQIGGTFIEDAEYMKPLSNPRKGRSGFNFRLLDQMNQKWGLT